MHYSLYHSWGIDSRLYIYQTYTSIRVLNITSLNCWGKLYLKTAVNELWVMHALLRRVLNERFCKHLLNNSYQYSVLFSCDQAALWMVQSVRLSVCLSVRHTFLTMFPSSYYRTANFDILKCFSLTSQNIKISGTIIIIVGLLMAWHPRLTTISSVCSSYIMMKWGWW